MYHQIQQVIFLVKQSKVLHKMLQLLLKNRICYSILAFSVQNCSLRSDTTVPQDAGKNFISHTNHSVHSLDTSDIPKTFLGDYAHRTKETYLSNAFVLALQIQLLHSSICTPDETIYNKVPVAHRKSWHSV